MKALYCLFLLLVISCGGSKTTSRTENLTPLHATNTVPIQSPIRFIGPFEPFSLQASDVFNRNMIGQRWHFQDSLGDNLFIDIEDAPVTDLLPSGCVQWVFTKDNFHGYWGPERFQPDTTLWFVLCPQSDGSWVSKASLLDTPSGCSFCPPGTTSFTLDVQSVNGQLTPFVIIPAISYANVLTTISTSYKSHWVFNQLTYNSILNTTNPSNSTVSWTTTTQLDDVDTPFYVGATMSSDQTEADCPNQAHEHWDFAPGHGLVRIQILENGSCSAFDDSHTMKRVF